MSGSYDPFSLSNLGEAPVGVERLTSRPRTWPWLAAGIVVVVLVTLIMGVARSGGSDGTIAYKIGEATGRSLIGAPFLALIVMFPIWLFGLRKTAPQKRWPYFGILTGVAFGLGILIGVSGVALDGLRQDKVAMAQIMRSLIAEQDASEQALLAELDSVDMDAMMTPKALSSATGRRRARAELDRREGLAARAMNDYHAMRPRFENRLVAKVANPGRRAQALAAFDKGMGAQAAMIERVTALQQQSFEIVDTQLDFLGHARWIAEGDTFAFYDDAGVAEFGRLQAEAGKVMAQMQSEQAVLDRDIEKNRAAFEREVTQLDGRP